MPRSIYALLLALTLVGCGQKTGDDSKAAQDEEQPAVADAQPKAPAFNELEWKIVDRNKAMTENPKLVEVVNDTNASDPLSAISQTYFSATSRINKMQMEYNARLQANLNADGAEDPKPPTFEEFNASAKMNSNNVKGLKPWQVYAYDESTGKVTILEDRELKKKLYEEQGLKYEE